MKIVWPFGEEYLITETVWNLSLIIILKNRSILFSLRVVLKFFIDNGPPYSQPVSNAQGPEIVNLSSQHQCRTHSLQRLSHQSAETWVVF